MTKAQNRTTTEMKPDPSVRAVRSSDWATVRQLMIGMLTDAPDAFGETLQEIEQRSNADWQIIVSGWADSTRAVAFLTEDWDEPCGFVRADTIDPRTPPGTVLVSNLWTAPCQRRRGLGRALMDAATQWANRRQAERIALGVTESNKSVLAFYSALGYRDTGRRAPAGLDTLRQVVVLARQLSPSAPA